MNAESFIPLIDLTRLVDNDSINEINALLSKAHTKFGYVAAVCVYPQYVEHAAEILKDTPVRIATVANFPEGTTNIKTVLNEIEQSCNDGAQEIDVVIPHHLLLQNNETKAIQQFLAECRLATTEQTLKVIIESSVLSTINIELASKLVINSGADFIKTSTGKSSSGGATQQAVDIICKTIKEAKVEHVGVKISGGVKTAEDAKNLIQPIQNYFGDNWIKPQHVRIGASSLINDLTK